MPATRCITNECDETSMATDVTPRSRMSASDAWRSGASGVVNPPDKVPMISVFRPRARLMDATRWAVVVLPLVPVIPITSMTDDGSPQNAVDKRPMASRTSSTTIWGTDASISGRGRSTTMATAPAFTAVAANS